MIWHMHHIIPKHMGGNNDKNNLIKVNVPMHAFLHKCLYEQYGYWQDELAWKALSGQIAGAKIAHEGRRLRMVGNKLWLGRTHSEETRKKLGPKKGTKFSKEHKEKLSKSWSYERHFTEETKKKLSAPRLNKRNTYEVTFPDGRIEIVVGIVEFCKMHNLSQPNLDKVVRGLRPHHKGFKCKKVCDGN